MVALILSHLHDITVGDHAAKQFLVFSLVLFLFYLGGMLEIDRHVNQN